MPDAYYCDDYEAITGKERGEDVKTEVIGLADLEAKVITAPEGGEPETSSAPVTTK